MASSDQRGRPKRAELPDVNINTGAQSINTERAPLMDRNYSFHVLLLTRITYKCYCRYKEEYVFFFLFYIGKKQCSGKKTVVWDKKNLFVCLRFVF